MELLLFCAFCCWIVYARYQNLNYVSICAKRLSLGAWYVRGVKRYEDRIELSVVSQTTADRGEFTIPFPPNHWSTDVLRVLENNQVVSFRLTGHMIHVGLPAEMIGSYLVIKNESRLE